jgi:cyclic pyranopterin phosphate synthase
VDLKAVLRNEAGNIEDLKSAILAAMAIKPERHHFDLRGEPVILRYMNATGG